MGAEAIKLPVFDFSSQDLKPGTPVWDSVKVQVTKALEEFGIFEALYDKIPREFQKEIFDALPELFNLPLETKLKNFYPKPYHGYIRKRAGAPLFETLGIDEPNILENVESFTKLMLPQKNSTLSKALHFYAEQVCALDKMVKRMVLESLGLEKYMDDYVDSAVYNLRFNQYEGPQTDETKLGQYSHTDKNMLSILHDNQVKGLEFLTKDGEWIKVSFSPNSFIVFIGDTFHAWTNGRLHNPYHRVMITGNDTRYTLGLFANPKPGCLIKAPEELVDEEHPPLYKPYEYWEYLAFCASDAASTCESPLEEYFRV